MKRKWNDKDIYEWAIATFGVSTPKAIATRMNKEMAELLTALENGQMEVAHKELADLRVFMGQLITILGPYCGDRRPLHELVDAKMDINQKREWEVAADGSHQHVENV